MEIPSRSEQGRSAHEPAPHQSSGVASDALTIERMKALADVSRLRIIEFLRNPASNCCRREDGVCGCDFEDLLGLSQPTVSHHLKILVNAGFLDSERRGRWTYYRLRHGVFRELSDYLGGFAEPANE